MDKQTVSAYQMGILFFVFMTGSSIINIPGPLIGKANNGAWLSLLISGAIGFLILAGILYLHKRYPGMTFVEYSRQLMGSALTAVFSVFTISFLLQMQSGIVNDVGLFMVSSMLRETPIYAFNFLIFAVSAVTVCAGLEVMARMFTLTMILITGCIILVLVIAVPDYDPAQLLPIMPKGIKPVLHGAYFTFGFPYVEVFLFAMLLPFVNNRSASKLPKTMVIALGINIIVLCISTVCSIMIFGSFAGEMTYVLFSLARVVEFEDIVQRIESIIGMSLILGSYMKTSITLYVLNLFVSQLFGIAKSRALVMPLALIGFLMGLVSVDSATDWGRVVMAVHPVWSFTAFVLPLLLLLIISMFKKPSA
ncbi:spore germination protein KB [Paenibacillus endophyticus]|uniref:Spore germination protein KB n=1 Tax=Paenibacillus endophyticus TaxID=1294268 RepID=A0A7W5CB00_9BACL|nr:GerAB/ArcD/ProY family transporter [Paenibacillus endophyticus]MBB3153424.1 spore germination protein KB [Paenibacillus endophyticus]